MICGATLKYQGGLLQQFVLVGVVSFKYRSQALEQLIHLYKVRILDTKITAEDELLFLRYFVKKERFN